ncbi:hypothetical protein M0R04_12155 [Candidatus Dojkabacteria bacterium]|jgi:hypothetical protein|nr:hypothetical protein [Candidatus Dojkabacteria bacterium]
MQDETREKIEQYDTGQALEIAKEKMQLSDEYEKLGRQLVEVKIKKAKEWTEIRLTTKSDAQADRKWDRTESGLAEMKLVLAMKCKEKKMSAISSMIQILNTSAHNLM